MTTIGQPNDNTPSSATNQPISDRPTYSSPQVRVNQQRVQPSAVNSQAVGSIITVDEVTTQTVTIPTGAGTVVTFTARGNQNRALQAVPEVSVFTGPDTNSTQWPTLTVHMGNLPVSVMNDQLASTDNALVTRVVLYNSTGATQIITLSCRHRIITNASNKLQSATV